MFLVKQIYSDSFVLEKGFLSARAEIESGAYDFGASDDEQAGEVSDAASDALCSSFLLFLG